MDRISNLPDEIILHILSFLSTDEAALTCVLSKRWRNLFAFSSNLQFRENKYSRENYINFVSRVLDVSGNSTVRRFSLDARLRFDFPYTTERWVRNVLSRGVLDLHLDIYNPASLFCEVFTCNTLVKLKLADFYPDMLPEDASLPLLKTLSIDSVGYDSLEAFGKLITACPLLEELIIDEFYWPYEELKCTHILSCPTLKKLTFKCFRNESYTKNFDLPIFFNLDSLFEAKLKLVPNDLGYCNTSNLIKGLRNVKILDLSSPQTLEVFGILHEAMPVFNNLFHLSVSSPRHACSIGTSLPSLLEKSPNLHALVIKGRLPHNHSFKSDCKCLVEYSCLSSCPVKVLQLTDYTGDMKELEQMKHFLKGFSCLELVKVCGFVKDVKEKMRLTTELQMLPRASSKCKIQVNF